MPDEPDQEQESREDAAAVLAAYDIDVTGIARIAQGLVNRTYVVDTPGDRYVLQRLHPVFHRSVNDNIDAVTRHLDDRGMLTPLLVRTTAGEVDTGYGDRIWRLLTFVEGVAHDRVPDVTAAASAGRLLARFHGALRDFRGRLVAKRPPIHDLERHLGVLGDALARHADHRLHAEIVRTAAELGEMVANTPPIPSKKGRLVHGDPKISNVLFDAVSGEARCLIDLDTLAVMPLAFELGDAFRSWCNPCGEDDPDAVFALDLFEAAAGGYAAGGYAEAAQVTAAECLGIVPATLTIHLELTARFLSDALEEAYFAWDAGRFPARGEHNLARARGQLSAARSLVQQLPEAQAIVQRRFACAA